MSIFINQLHTVNHKMHKTMHKPMYQRAAAGLLALVVVVTVASILLLLQTNARYSISHQVNSILTPLIPALAHKISYDATGKMFIFNILDGSSANTVPANATKNMRTMQQQIGGGQKNTPSLYSAELPTDASKGIRYYDKNTQLGFSLSPTFSELSGRQQNGRIVYPSARGVQVIYTAKGNGLKEDIAIPKSLGDQVTFSYKLKLPSELRASLLPDGSLGLYSADPSLYGNISYGSNLDKLAVMKARQKSAKTNLVFLLPAPSVTQSRPTSISSGNAYFTLKNNVLSIHATNLSHLTYPVSIDPSVIISSSAAFSTGNNEDSNIAYPTNEIMRGSVSGGTISTNWSTNTANPLPQTVDASMSVAYNGYVYVMGGYNGTVNLSTVYYAPINADGSIGAWITDTANPLPQLVDAGMAVTANGYVYVMGGYQYGTTTFYSTVYHAPISSTNGSIGAWITDTANPLPQAFQGGTAIVYDNYVYVMGGSTNTAKLSTVYYAPLHADGSIGAWVTDTANPLPQTLDAATSVVYNGYVYVMGGYNAAPLSTVYFAPIASNGAVGAWRTNTNALPQTIDGASSVVSGGYIYEIGGYTGAAYLSTTYYAPINGDGSVGTWTQTAILPQTNSYAPAVVYSGYVYVLGGANAALTASVFYGKIDPDGVLAPWVTSSSLVKQGTGLGVTGRENISLVVYGGYIYSMGGDNGTTQAYNEFAPLNSDGTLGTWAAATSLPASYAGISAVAYNGYMFIFTGCTAISAGSCGTHTTAISYSAPITAGTGVLGSWTAQTAPPTALWQATPVLYNGYIYLLGGITSGTTYTNSVSYALLTTTGTIATNAGCGTAWCSAAAFTTARAQLGATVSGNYLYVVGGTHATSDTACNATANVNCSDTQYALITSTGALSSNTCGTSVTWCTTTSLPTAVAGGTASINGYLYSAEGYYGKVSANGTVSSWVATTTFATTRTNFGSTYYSNHFYIVAGNAAGTYQADTQYAIPNNGGIGLLTSWTTNTNPLPTGVADGTSVVNNGYIYELGGTASSGSVAATIYYAPINADGSVGTWINDTANPLPQALKLAASFVYNGFIYEVGGQNGSNVSQTTVYYAPLNADGSLGAWINSAHQLPACRDSMGRTVYKGYIYIVGGGDCSSVIQSTILYAPISATGDIGAWVTATNSMPAALFWTGVTSNNGYLYVLGGTSGGSSSSSNTYYAAINADGSIGTWSAGTSLPTAVYLNTIIVYDGYIYSVAGSNGSAQVATVNYASLEANGKIGAWSATAPLPQIMQSASTDAANGTIYELGGYNGAFQSTVYYATLQAIPRVAHYSKLVDFGNTNNELLSISYSGSLSLGTQSISYRLAGSNATFSSAQTAAYLAANQPNPLTCIAAGSGTRYALVYVTMDDSLTASFPDSQGTVSNLTSLNLNYYPGVGHPLPNVRLRNGHSFYNSVLQPYDTCNT